MASVDRWEPKLRVPRSDRGGSGYRIPTRPQEDGKPLLVPGVTTVLGVLDKPGVLQWSVDQVVAYAVLNLHELEGISVEQGFKRLRFYPKRMKESEFDEPEFALNNVHTGVLNDLAELGSKTHDWVSDFTTDQFPDDPERDEQAQMVAAFMAWWDQNDVEVVATEVTVVGNGYAGTFDFIWRINGVLVLGDLKTSRAVRDEHLAQLGALGAAESMLVETTEDDPEGVLYESKKWGKTYWREEPIPAFTEYAIIHLRPAEEGREPLCEMISVPHTVIDAGFELFKGALAASEGRYGLKMAKREAGFDV